VILKISQGPYTGLGCAALKVDGGGPSELTALDFVGGGTNPHMAMARGFEGIGQEDCGCRSFPRMFDDGELENSSE